MTFLLGVADVEVVEYHIKKFQGDSSKKSEIIIIIIIAKTIRIYL